MRAQITSFKQQESKYGDSFYYVFFKDENGKSLRSCIYQNMRNFTKWKSVLKSGMILENLNLKSKGLINADSNFKIIGVREFPKQKPNQSQLDLKQESSCCGYEMTGMYLEYQICPDCKERQ